MLLLRMRSHPLPEARRYADLMLVELRKVIPSFLQRVDLADRGGVWSELPGPHPGPDRGGGGAAVARRSEPEEHAAAVVTLEDWDPDGEDKVIAAICYPHMAISEADALRRVRALAADESGPSCGPTSGTGPIVVTVPVGPSNGPTTASTSSPTTAPSATFSAIGC